MQGPHLRKYGAAATIPFDLFEVDGVDLRVDGVHAAGDTTIMKDEGAPANTGSGFVDEGEVYSLALTATEMQAARIVIKIVDQTATKVWLDKTIIIETYGHASAQHAFDLDTANVTLAAATHTGAVIPTVTNLSNLPAITANWLTAAGIAAAALNGKGDWNTVVPDAAGVVPTAVENRQEMDSNSADLNAIITNIVGLNNLSTAQIDAAFATFWTSPATLVALIWNEILSKASYNIGQSAAKMMRQMSDITQIDGAVSDVSPSVTGFDTNLTQVDGYFDDAVMIFANGAANVGIGRPVVTHLNANGAVTFIPPDDWPVTPVDGDDFVIFANHVHPITQIQLGLATEAKQDTAQTGLALILADTNELQTDWENDGRLDLILDSVLAMLDDPRAEPGQGAPAANADAMTKLDYVYKAWRNKIEQTSTTYSLYDDAGTTVDHKSTDSDDGTTATKGEIVSGA